MANRTKARAPHTERNGAKRRGLSPEPRFAATGEEIQRYGSLRLLPIALAAEARLESARSSTRSSPTR